MTARILVAEDDRIVFMEIQDTLESLGYKVVGVASSGPSAIEQAAEDRPDLVLMDIRLRGTMDGVEAATEIRNRFDIPVVYLTAFADDNTLQRAKITEPYGYIIKPFQERELHTAIEMALYKHGMERKLKENERWLATMLKSIGDAVIATDVRGVVSFMNSVAEALTGWEQTRALGTEVTEIFQVVDRETRIAVENPAEKALRKGKAGGLTQHILLAKDGREIPIGDTTSLITDEQGNTHGAIVVFRDVTDLMKAEEERERLQTQLFQAQKMEAIGVLAGSIAHKFNNLMTTIIGYSSLILSDLNDGDPLRSGIDYVKRAGEQAASLTKQLLALSRKQMSQTKVLDLNSIIAGMDTMLQRLVGQDIQLIKALDPGLGYVKGDPTQLEQVIINLVVNAREAMPEGGRIIIETENTSLRKDHPRDLPEAQSELYVCLSVTDTGVGMDDETLEHIFEPFFSTKEKGAGLGLSIAHNIVTQHDGYMEVFSEVEKGTILRVYLPIFAMDVDYEETEVVPLPEPQGAGEQILLVEDDEGVRAAVSEMLKAGGYEVTGVGSVAEALELFDREAGNFDLVFSDVVLPDRDGLELVNLLLSQKPDLPVLLTSGYTDQRSQWPMIRDRGLAFLQKPFSLFDLLPAVREALKAGQIDGGTLTPPDSTEP